MDIRCPNLAVWTAGEEPAGYRRAADLLLDHLGPTNLLSRGGHGVDIDGIAHAHGHANWPPS